MDFSRSTQPTAAPVATGHSKRVSGGGDNSTLKRVAVVVASAILATLLIALALLAFGSKGNSESKLVDKDRLQAVFLNTGQVYFGKISDLNSKFFVVTNIYYLQTSTSGTTEQNQNTSVSLVKLGCELHEPFDKMVINREQVTFWENLQDNGQVAEAVKTFQKQNPNGQKCTDQGASASGSTTNNVQNAGTASPTGTGTGTGATTPTQQR